ncbi:molybdate transport system ATP-binding protein [Agromyces cerinus subsp. cerinus]|uniref:Molybdate transport system ATP-binding protein n=1 Tax=Agromyces cerinus subsp. cerinus TaxID=232089 RepID=A0A1N6DD86_9MICO|nr:ATP-binding cassette domain-containing protein [Agromyces cerinus]SIN68623.1 molybdate transport system ATP-binding protein [Agromyces cerinus subsp. cerinus]
MSGGASGGGSAGGAVSATSAGLVADVAASIGAFELRARIEVAPGEILAVLGPNGAGKSTLLHAIAGTVLPDSGSVHVGGRELTRRGAGPRSAQHDVAPEQRRVGLLGQQPLLFPHLSVLENVAFAARARGARTHAARAAARARLEQFGLAELALRRPRQLSGGQQQRVALARTLAAEPEVLLLDEPFAALDVQAAAEMRELISGVPGSARIPVVLVTHDPLDAIVLARRSVVLQEGRIAADGATSEVLGHPTTPFAAALAGVNLVVGSVDDEGCVVVPATPSAHGQGVPLFRLRGSAPGTGTGDTDPPVGSAASAVFSPGAVHAAPADHRAPAASAVNRWTGTVAQLRPVPGGVRIGIAELPDLVVDVPSAAAVSLDLTTGARLDFTIPAAEVSVRALPASVLR